MEKIENSIFEKLSKINVNDKIEKKNGLNYLSWAYAWGELKKIYPNANYKIYETETGCIYHTDGKTCWVKTGVIINELEYIEYLPVMDYKNKSIPLKDVTSFDVNKAIQRSLTKALARHGLGLYIYAGEDLPEAEKELNEKKNYLKIIISKLSDARKIDKKELCDEIMKKYGDINKMNLQEIETLINELKGG